jgi:hypothetical protein
MKENKYMTDAYWRQKRTEECEVCGIRVYGNRDQNVHHFHDADGLTLCITCAADIHGIGLEDWHAARAVTPLRYLSRGGHNASWLEDKWGPILDYRCG